ncbi:MAG: tetratricopeptide repeat protein [Flavisolibacter sp.]
MNFTSRITFIFFTVLSWSCKPSVKQLMQAAEFSDQEKKYQESIKLYSKVIETDSSIQLAYLNRGICYYNLDRHIEAINDFNTIMAMHPKVEPGTAVFTWSKNALFIPDSLKWKVSDVEALYQRALARYALNDLKSAYRDFAACSSYNSYEAASDKWIGIIYLRTGDAGKRLSIFEKGNGGR